MSEIMDGIASALGGSSKDGNWSIPADSAPTQPAAPQQASNDSIMEHIGNALELPIEEPKHVNSPLRGAKVLGENAAHWVTGGVGQIAGGWRELYGTVMPTWLGGDQDTTEATNAGQKVANALTYQPSSEGGKLLASVPGSVFNTVENKLNTNFRKIGGAAPIGTIATHPGQTLGDEAYGLANKIPLVGDILAPYAGAAAASIPTAIATLAGARQASETADSDIGSVPAGASEVEPSVDIGGRTEPGPESTGRTMAGGGSAVANSNPYPELTGEEGARGVYPVVKLSKTPSDVAAPEQAARSDIATQILGDRERVRTGVITGNEDTLRNEYTLARAPNPTMEGLLLKQQIGAEQNALSDFAAKRVDATGANPHFVNDYQRGEFVNNVMAGPDGLTGFLNAQKKGIYDQAKATVGDNPVATPAFDSLIANPQFKAELKLKGITDFTNGLQDLSDIHKTTGFSDTAPNSIAGLEQLRQSLNRQWSPQNKYAIGKVVEAIDSDVANAGGPGLYAQGRAIHAAQKSLFDSPGMKTLFGDMDPNGVQTATAFEKIPDKLNNMPFDQWRHVYDTLDYLSRGQIPGMPEGLTVPKDLQFAAGRAREEVAGGLARDVYEAGAKNVGTWSANAANKVMNSRAMKISHAMPPDEQAAFHTLNYGGQIMPGAHSYEGAGLQTSRMNQMGLMEKHAPAAGSVIGEGMSHLTGVPALSWVGEKAGEKLQGTLGVRRQLELARKLDAQMEANAKLGKK